jgi:putative addiction module component (TIGR02574 family)
MTTAHLEAEILKLPRSVRARLAERLLSSLDEDNEIEQAWAEEADRRYQAYLKGEERARPVEDVMASIRKELGIQ